MRWLVTAALLALAAPAAAQQPPPTEPPTAEVLRDRAAARLGVFEIADAADALEMLARLYPKEASAPDALRQAAALRLALGQQEAASNAVRAFERSYGRKAPNDTDELVMFVARTLSDDGAHELARSLVARRPWRDPVDRIVALGIEGHAALAAGKSRDADEAFDAILGQTDRVGAMRALSRGIGDDAAAVRRLGTALTVVGEARHRRARAKRDALALDRVPRFRGPRERQRLDRFFRDEIGPWLTDKHAAIEAAEEAYISVLRIEPAPPPQWVIASGADVAAMWSELLDAIESLPEPALDRSLLDIYRSSMDHVASPILRRAKQAARICVDYGTKYWIANEDTRRCERWLVDRFPEEYVPTVTLGLRGSHVAVPNPPRALQRGETD